MGNFEKIFEKAEYVVAESKRTKEIIDSKENNTASSKSFNYETDCYSERLLSLIKNYGFNIESYERFDNTDILNGVFDAKLEIYHCTYNNWSFDIQNIYSQESFSNIFELRKIENIITSEKVNLICDLSCKFLSVEKLNEVLGLLMYNSLKEYVENKYERFFNLPEYLKRYGYLSKDVDYLFDINSPKGYLKINSTTFLKIYKDNDCNFKVVITNDEDFDINFCNDSLTLDGKRAYFFDYNKTEDIGKLINCIEAFIDEQNGEIGYLEEGVYYSNKDVLKIYNEAMKEMGIEECGYKFNIEHIKPWVDEYLMEGNENFVNKYKGVEIFVSSEMTFRGETYDTNDYINTSYIRFEYDKRKDVKNCTLKIDNYVYKASEGMETYNYDANEYIINKNKLVDSIEISDTFTNLEKVLKEYILKMCSIYNIA